jgi:hypothetical protein
MTGFDFADPDSGISATLRPSGVAVIFDHDDVLASAPQADAHLTDGDPESSVRMQLDGTSLKLGLAPIAAPLTLSAEGTAAEELTVCRVLGELDTGGKARPISCLGIRTEGVDNDEADASLTRSIAVAFGDGGILALDATRPRGAETHAEEEIVAAFADPEGIATTFTETLLSTQYDEEGRQVRASLELWPDQESAPSPGRRAAGTIVCGTSLMLGERRLDLAIFRWSMDGTPGLGRYEVLSSLENA